MILSNGYTFLNEVINQTKFQEDFFFKEKQVIKMILKLIWKKKMYNRQNFWIIKKDTGLTTCI